MSSQAISISRCSPAEAFDGDIVQIVALSMQHSDPVSEHMLRLRYVVRAKRTYGSMLWPADRQLMSNQTHSASRPDSRQRYGGSESFAHRDRCGMTIPLCKALVAGTVPAAISLCGESPLFSVNATLAAIGPESRPLPSKPLLFYV